MNKILMIAATVLSMGLGSAAMALTVAPTQSIKIAGNDSNPTGQTDLKNWITGLDLYQSGFAVFEIAKVNEPATSSGSMTVSYDTGQASGSWAWSGMGAISFVVYKAGNEFVAHYYDPGLTGNMWNTQDLGLINTNNGNGREISHITLYGVDGTPKMPPIPLPAGGVLLLSGLGFLAARRHLRS